LVCDALCIVTSKSNATPFRNIQNSNILENWKTLRHMVST
jgi:hypothetical protein